MKEPATDAIREVALTRITMEAARVFLVTRTGIPPELAEGLILRWLHLDRLRWTCAEAIEFVPRDGKMVALDQLSVECRRILDTLWRDDGQRLDYSWQRPHSALVSVHDVKQVEGKPEPSGIYLAAHLFVDGLTVAQEDLEKLAFGMADRRQGELELAVPPDQKGLTIILLRQMYPPNGVVPEGTSVPSVRKQLLVEWPVIDVCERRYGVKLAPPSEDSVGRRMSELREAHEKRMRDAKSAVAADVSSPRSTPR